MRPAAFLRERVTIRRVRLITGLVILAYVLSHLVNHALGNVSLDAIEAWLDVVAPVWAATPVASVLYGSLLAHAALGIWAIYARPRLDWRPGEVAQLALGLSLPPLLVAHVVGTKIANVLYGTTQGYSQLLYLYGVLSPADGLRQALALCVAWGHGCIGLYFWLRLKRGFARWSPALLCGAILVPVLALLGLLQGARAVAVLAADEAWRMEYAPLSAADSAGAGAQLATLRMTQTLILAGFGACVALAFSARFVRGAVRRGRGLVRVTYPDGRVSTVPRGTSVLEASRLIRMPHASVCGGKGRCSTCRVRIAGDGLARLDPADPAERAVLDRLRAGPAVRLACQLRPTHDVTVAPLIPTHGAAAAAQRRPDHSGEERVVVAMFVDMRGSTRMAEGRLPFDTVFLINRFLEAVARAVQAAGGDPNQFLGDGMLALFGLRSTPAEAARAALAATAGIAREVETLNAVLAHDLAEPLRFGIGIHAGTAVLGEIGGDGGHRVFTAIGDPVNVAARLQAMTKRLGAEAVVSDAVFGMAGLSPPGPARDLAIDGRDASIAAHALARAEELA